MGRAEEAALSTATVLSSPVAEIPKIVASLRGAFDAGRTRPLAWRAGQLAGIRRMLEEKEEAFLDALQADLGKPNVEAFAAEIAFTRAEVRLTERSLRSWTSPRRVGSPLFVMPARSSIVQEPLGVVLVIGPWNYPLQLVLAPLVGAVAAGNCAVLKPSELAVATSNALARYLPLYVDPDCVRVVEGAVPETTALLEQRFDHIFYTGNGAVGRIVMTAAARHLTPVTLELGGKSPCIVDRDVDLDVAVRRIAWGKFYNAGQTCVAPDYVLVHHDVHDRFLDALVGTIRRFYGDEPKASPDYARIVNVRHHRRLSRLLDSGRIVLGGETDEASRYIAPTVQREVPLDSPVMSEEIFGPILPVLPVGSVDDAIRFVNAREKPLALYVFSSRPEAQQRVISRTSSGGAAINHVWLHLAVPGLPFGGVGESGMGAYHGRHTFQTFSHQKAVLAKPTWSDPSFQYPPYTAWAKRLFRWLL